MAAYTIGAGGAVQEDPQIRKPKPVQGPVDHAGSFNVGANEVTAYPQPVQPQLTPPIQTPVPQNLQATVGPLFQQQPASPVQTAFQDNLLQVLQRAQQPVGINDPQLQPASDVFRATRSREAERARSVAAERAAQTGTLGAGGFDAEVGQIENARGLDIANYDANLVLGEMNARRGQLMQGLALAQAQGNAEAERQIRTQLALLDASLDESQFGRELGFRGDALNQQGQLGRGQLANQLLSILLGSQLGYDTLGSNNAQWLADFNRRSVLDVL